MVRKGDVYIMDDGNFKWTIDDFISFIDVRSRTFKIEDISFSLRISVDLKEDRLQLVLQTRNRTPKRFFVCLEMSTGVNGKSEFRSGFMDENGYYCIRNWMPWTEMLKRRLEILSNGSLTIKGKLRNAAPMLLSKKRPSEEANIEENEHCDSEEDETSSHEGDEENAEEVNAVSGEDSDDEDTTPLPESFKKLQKALKTLLISGEDSDVTIKVQGKEFPAHKGILRVRSSVFKSMFTHEMAEKQTGIVTIDDCDPETFPDFLNYVYTGSTSHINAKNVFTLYTTSDKYGVDELKEECLLFMKCNLAVETFCDTISLALRHQEKELITLATEFFCDNTPQTTDTKEWQVFLAENATTGNELFRKALKK